MPLAAWSEVKQSAGSIPKPARRHSWALSEASLKDIHIVDEKSVKPLWGRNMPDLDWFDIAITTAYTTVVGVVVLGVIWKVKNGCLRVLRWCGMKMFPSFGRTERRGDSIPDVPVTVHTAHASYDAAPDDDGILHVLALGDSDVNGPPSS